MGDWWRAVASWAPANAEMHMNNGLTCPCLTPSPSPPPPTPPPSILVEHFDMRSWPIHPPPPPRPPSSHLRAELGRVRAKMQPRQIPLTPFPCVPQSDSDFRYKERLFSNSRKKNSRKTYETTKTDRLHQKGLFSISKENIEKSKNKNGLISRKSSFVKHRKTYTNKID